MQQESRAGAAEASLPTLPNGAKKKSLEEAAMLQADLAAKNADPAEKWKEITVEMWRDAVYTNQTYFGELISDTSDFVKTIAENIKLGGQRVSLVEVGCGTGEFVRAVAPDFRTVVGVDFNQEFIDFCKEHDIPRRLARSKYIQGDACQLYDLLKEEFPKTLKPGSRGVEFWDDTRVVACVGNTIGIIPEELRPKVYEQMAEVAGQDGVLVMVYWNARWFGDACLNFYHANPQLCGPFEGESVDFKNTTLTTPMNYKTKWTSVEEARTLMEDLGMEIISLREKGKGVFVAARRF
jgi:SAM-dependent methyltransferase